MVKPTTPQSVSLRPEVLFLRDLLDEIVDGSLRIPRFQRPFVWKRNQMTDLLDSVLKQYPIGSLLIWQTDTPVETLSEFGPFRRVEHASTHTEGYLLDGHQRSLTLTSALITQGAAMRRDPHPPGNPWDLYWNVEDRLFQHGNSNSARNPKLLFPLTSLLDTVAFIDEIQAMGSRGMNPDQMQEISHLARSFQSYKIPVIRLRQTTLGGAVEIFARLNSRGEPMTADQMVSALTYSRTDSGKFFSLSSKIDEIALRLAEQDFGDIDRGTILRCILASMGENIYRTDWTKLTSDRFRGMESRLAEATEKTAVSVDRAVSWLKGIGVPTSRLLPYGAQLVALTSFFNERTKPSTDQQILLERWFWFSSFRAWFGGANPSRVSALLTEFRNGLPGAPRQLKSMDLSEDTLPYPSNFDMRSARTRALLLAMLAQEPSENGVKYVNHITDQLSRRGPVAVGYFFSNPPFQWTGDPANRAFRPPSLERGSLAPWVQEAADRRDVEALDRIAVDEHATQALLENRREDFLDLRRTKIQAIERNFLRGFELRYPSETEAEAPVDVDLED